MLLTTLAARNIDDLIRTDLIKQRDWYAGCIFWSTLGVVVGCAMEVPEVIHELWPRLFAPRFERPIKIVASIGLGFVVLGVAGELCFEHWRAAYEGLVQGFDNILLVDAEGQAVAAQQRANDAATEAGNLGVKVDKLPSFIAQKENEVNRNVTQFRQYASSAQAQTADVLTRLKADTDALNKARDAATAAAEQAEHERAEAEAVIAPRYLTPTQQADFVVNMTSFQGLRANILITPSNTGDAGPLASLFESLLRQAHWTSATMQGFSGWSKYVLICVGKNPKANVESAAEAIVLQLRAANITAFVDTDLGPDIPASGSGGHLPNPDMTIIIGSKQ